MSSTTNGAERHGYSPRENFSRRVGSRFVVVTGGEDRQYGYEAIGPARTRHMAFARGNRALHEAWRRTPEEGPAFAYA